MSLGRVPLGRLVLGAGGASPTSISDTLTFSETLTSIIANTSLADTLVLTDSATYTLRSTVMRDILSFTESLVPDSGNIHDRLTFTDRFNRRFDKSISDVLLLTDGIHVPKTGTLTDSVTFSDSIARLANRYLLTPDVLTFSDTVTRTSRRKLALADTISLTDTFKTTGTYHKSLSDSMVFHDGLILRVAKHGTSVIIPGGNDIPTQAVIYIQSHVILRGMTRAITLPAPNFNDQVSSANKMIIKRAMSGLYRTYIKTATRSKYHWSFTIPRPVGDALKLFMYVEGNNEIDVEDWGGRFYKMKVLSNSLDFTETRRWEPCGNAMDVTIEFEGYQYA